jgi:transposase
LEATSAALNREKMLRSPLLKRLIAQRLRQVERQIKAIDAALRALCVADADLNARLGRERQIGT